MKVLIIGATGLVGRHLVDALVEDAAVRSIVLFVRRDSGIPHPKITQHIVDFNRLSEWKEKIAGDVLLSALGTTISAAGSKDAFFRLDHDTNLAVANAACANGVPRFLLVSSQGADTGSPFFYLKTKGRLEEAIRKLSFASTIFFRPSLLVGKRDGFRLKESLSAPLLRLLSRIPGLKRLRPVPGAHLARVMASLAGDPTPGVREMASAEILDPPVSSRH